MRNTILLALVGLISGLLSFLINYLPFLDVLLDQWKLFIAAGFVFGVVIALYFLLLQKQASIMKLLLWIAASIGSYYVAVITVIDFPFTLDYPDEFFFPLISGGIVGAFLMLLGFKHLLHSISKKQLLELTFLGGILGLSWYIIPDHLFFPSEPPNDVFAGEKLLSLYIFWQMGMAGALGWVMDRAGNGKNR